MRAEFWVFTSEDYDLEHYDFLKPFVGSYEMANVYRVLTTDLHCVPRNGDVLFIEGIDYHMVVKEVAWDICKKGNCVKIWFEVE